MLEVFRRPARADGVEACQEESLRKPVVVSIASFALCLGVIALAWAQIPMVPGLTAPAKDTAAPSTPAPGSPAPGGATAPSAIPPEKPPGPIPVGEILKRAEEVTAYVRSLDVKLPPDAQIARIESQLPVLGERLTQRFERTQRTIESRPPLGIIDDMTDSWQSSEIGLRSWLDTLTARAVWLDEERQRLATLDKTWSLTRQAQGTRLPAYMVGHVDGVRSSLASAQGRVETQRVATLRLQDSVVREVKRCDEALVALESARRQAESDLFSRASPSVWSAAARQRFGEELSTVSWSSIEARFANLRRFAESQAHWIGWHVALIVTLVALFWIARRWARDWRMKETLSPSVVTTFERPLELALLLGVVSGAWLYVDPPRQAVVILAAIALFPAVLVLRRLLPPPLVPALYALAALFLIDRLRNLLGLLPTLEGSLFLAEMLAAIALLVLARWYNRTRDYLAVDTWAIPGRTPAVLVRVAFVLLTASVVIGATGNTSLARLLGSGTLNSAYLALLLIATRRLLEGIWAFLLRVRPLNLLRLVEPYRIVLEARAHVIVGFLTTTAWVIGTLNVFGILTPTAAVARRILGATWTHGSLNISVGDVIAFFVTIYASFLVSAMVRVVLEEEVFPRFRLRPGLPYAMTSLLRYAIIFIGFILAVLILGINLDRVTILGGAFGIGVGFGLQNVVNNFVSGLIVLFERPVRVGDAVQIGDVQGEVRRIGIRSSTVRTWEGAEVVVPNSMLVSDKVTNWTPTDRRRRITIPVNVAYGSAPDDVLKVLGTVAQQNSALLPAPMPQPLFLGFGDYALKFELRVWTDRLDRVDALKTELGIAVYGALREAGIAIAVAREIRIQDGPPPS
jgi:small-conductance mechanosensitive channel